MKKAVTRQNDNDVLHNIVISGEKPMLINIYQPKLIEEEERNIL